MAYWVGDTNVGLVFIRSGQLTSNPNVLFESRQIHVAFDGTTTLLLFIAYDGH